mmetsp:Transcript_2507/g.4491  ORF Transcript_2507/g.4491 Transcript_2507/m.4491 type:complete len:202 (+) Transcript_2507:1536-2141(+)
MSEMMSSVSRFVISRFSIMPSALRNFGMFGPVPSARKPSAESRAKNSSSLVTSEIHHGSPPPSSSSSTTARSIPISFPNLKSRTRTASSNSSIFACIARILASRASLSLCRPMIVVREQEALASLSAAIERPSRSNSSCSRNAPTSRRLLSMQVPLLDMRPSSSWTNVAAGSPRLNAREILSTAASPNRARSSLASELRMS